MALWGWFSRVFSHWCDRSFIDAGHIPIIFISVILVAFEIMRSQKARNEGFKQEKIHEQMDDSKKSNGCGDGSGMH